MEEVNFSVFFNNSKFRTNIIVLIAFFSLSTAGYHVSSFYMALSPGNIYLNYAYLGLATTVSALLVFKTQQIIDIVTALKYFSYSLMFFSLLFCLTVDPEQNN